MKRCSNCNFPNIDSDRNCFKCGSLLPTDSLEETTQSTESNTSTENLDQISAEPKTVDSKATTAPSKSTKKTKSKGQPTPSKDSTAPEVSPHVDASSIKEPTTSESLPTTKDIAPLLEDDCSTPKLKIESDELITKPNPVFDSNTNIIDFIRTPTHPDELSSEDGISSLTQNVNKGQASSHSSNLASQEAAATSVPLPTTPVPSLTTSPPRPGTPARITPKYGSLARLKILSKVLGVLFGLALFTGGGFTLYVGKNMLSLIICVGLIGLGILNIFLGFVIGAALEWLNDVECNQRKQIELISHVYHKINS